jgi:hypothetical protein
VPEFNKNTDLPMKKFLVVVAAAAFVMSLPSCKKCSTCKYTIAGITTTQPELCGKKDEVKAYEDACAVIAALGGTTCTCEKS